MTIKGIGQCNNLKEGLGRDWKTIDGQCNEMEANVEVIVHDYDKLEDN
jgi:hypothetical protein